MGLGFRIRTLLGKNQTCGRKRTCPPCRRQETTPEPAHRPQGERVRGHPGFGVEIRECRTATTTRPDVPARLAGGRTPRPYPPVARRADGYGGIRGLEQRPTSSSQPLDQKRTGSPCRRQETTPARPSPAGRTGTWALQKIIFPLYHCCSMIASFFL